MRRADVRRFHPEAEFGGFTDIDGGITFYARAQELLPPGGVALDIGCGRGLQSGDPVRIRRELQTLRGRCRHVIGIDIDPAGARNERVDEFRLIPNDGRWPVEDGTIELAIADFVIEHVADPEGFLAEAARVVRPGGHLGIRTINAHSYVGLVSRMIPNRMHCAALGGMDMARARHDVFPTVYRSNTIRALRRGLLRHGFAAAVYGVETEPVYLAFNAWAYRLGLLHRRLAPGFMRVGLVAWARRL